MSELKAFVERHLRWIEPALAVVLSLLTAPIWAISDTGIIRTLDPSWRIALHQIFLDDLHWGEDVVNTLGPLGWMAYPMLSAGHTAWWSQLFFSLTHIAAIWLTLRLLRRRLGLVPSIGLTWLLTQFAWNPIFEAALLAEALSAMFALHCLDRLARVADRIVPTPDADAPGELEHATSGRATESRPDWWREPAVLGMVVTLLLLVKLSTGLQAGIVGATTLLALTLLERRPWAEFARAAGVYVGAGLVSYAVVWLLLGQPLGLMFSYLRKAVSMAGAYAGAMGAARPELEWTVPTGLVLAMVFALVAAARWRRVGWVPLVAMLLPVGAFLFFTFKLGFVRTDGPHVVPFFLSLALVAVALLSSRRGEAAVAVLVVVAAIVLGWNANPTDFSASRVLGVADNLSQTGDNLQLLVDGGHRDELVAEFRAASRARAGFAPELVDRLAGTRVHVDPNETSLLWIHDEFEWGAPPVFQSYLAYTPGFDEMNADWLRRDEVAPDHILRTPFAIDRRSPAFETPAYMIEMVCRYHEVATHVDGRGRRATTYSVLERTANRCGEPSELRRLEVVAGTPARLGQIQCDGLPLFRVEGFETMGQRLRTTFYKDATYTVRFGRRAFRLTPATAAGWHLFPSEGLPAWAAEPQPLNRFQLAVDGAGMLTPSTFELVIGCLPYTPAG